MSPVHKLALFAVTAAIAWVAPPVSAQSDTDPAVSHTRPLPSFLSRVQPHEAVLGANAGTEFAYDIDPDDALADHRRLTDALAALAPQRPGTVDAYVLSIALDSDPVFGREAREAARVLARRYGADYRVITLAAPDGNGDASLPHGSLTALSITLARIAELMDPAEDVLIFYATSHGLPEGIVYYYGDQGYGTMSPLRLSTIMGQLRIANRLIIMNACFSGNFVRGLSSPTSVVVSAAAADRTSFGCTPTNDWTYFGDAFINRSLRRSQPLADAFEQARIKITQWESDIGMTPSEPQIAIGRQSGTWLDVLEGQMPQSATAPVGRPANADARPARR
ncbi:C13 family peptidase [Parasphingopyxis sp.]|uniref:C13 family peptidase n=1 Tax=Parasphingopyxis sp. TaxID=1920299 RepID=UPI00262DB30C|nr:C13 family peptidase [Parasphingopyxis sp.]